MQICVDNLQGVDDQNCFDPSSKTNVCCQTVQHAIANSQDGTTINIHGGQPDEKPRFYSLNQTIEIRHNLTIQGSPVHQAPIVIFNKTISTSLQYAFTFKASNNYPTKFKISRVNFQDMNIVSCANGMCDITLHESEAVCKGCSTSFIKMTSSSPTKLSTTNTYFESDKYCLYSSSKNIEVNFSNVTLVSGSRVFMKNRVSSKYNIVLNFTDMKTFGLFKYYAISLDGYFSNVNLDRIHFSDSTFPNQGMRLRLKTNTKDVNFEMAELKLKDVEIRNVTGKGSELFDIERCNAVINNINIRNSGLTTVLNFQKVIGNITNIEAYKVNLKHVASIEWYSEVNIQHIHATQCHFENVTLADYRLGGAYSRHRHKGLLFFDLSQATLHNITVLDNYFGCNIVYLTDSSAFVSDVLFQGNYVKKFALEYTDRGQLWITNSSIVKNIFETGILYAYFGTSLNITNVQIHNNQVAKQDFTRFVAFFTRITPLTLEDVSIQDNQQIDIIELVKSDTRVINMTIKGNFLAGTIFYMNFDQLLAIDLKYIDNTVHITTAASRHTLMAFDRVDANIQNLYISNNTLSGSAVTVKETTLKMRDVVIVNNYFGFHAVQCVIGSNTEIDNLVLTGNTMQRGIHFYFSSSSKS